MDKELFSMFPASKEICPDNVIFIRIHDLNARIISLSLSLSMIGDIDIYTCLITIYLIHSCFAGRAVLPLQASSNDQTTPQQCQPRDGVPCCNLSDAT